MTSRLFPAVIVEASGLVTMCAWCCPPAQLAIAARLYTVSHGLCPACDAALNAEMDARAVPAVWVDARD